ncbi:MAG: serine/threonine protein kinase [Deltaproteobacteria bacterium]|nr:serine/threonine protein kinase [Deltaproteobacteria bacterium]
MRHLSLGSFTCPFCNELHPRSVTSCPRTGEVLAIAHKMGGTVLDRKYSIKDVLAEGGMGVVYRGEQKRIERTVAVKFLNIQACDTLESYERFMREAKIAASVDHPSVVEVFDLGATQGGVPYIVMEYLRGQDLSSRIREAVQLDVSEAVSITEQILEALQAVHSAGIVHRDLKPENVFIARQSGGSSIVKILDFGVSRLIRDDDEVKRITEAGKVYGTPHYVSPEQACGDRDADHRSDLYSVAVLLYEMLVGAPPFDSVSPAKLIVDIATAPAPNPLERRSDIPPAIAGFILRGMEKDRTNRFQFAKEMLRALRIARNIKPLRPRKVMTSRRRPATSGTYRIISPPEEVVVSKVPYRELMGSNVIPGPNGVEKIASSPAARRDQARTQPINRSRHPTPGHRADITPNPDMGDPDEH